MDIISLILLIIRSLSIFFWVYSVLCSIRIVLTWIPDLRNGFTNFLSRICDPYLDYFSKRGLLVIGGLNFSPILAISILYLLATLFSQLGLTGTLTFGFILGTIVSSIWNIIASIFGFLIFIFLIRLIVIFAQGSSFHVATYWKLFDSAFQPIIYKIANTISNGKLISYKSALLSATIILAVINIAGSIFFHYLCSLIFLIPF